MKLLIINSVCGIRSTGRIAIDIASEFEKKGYVVKIAYGREEVPQEFKRLAVRIGNDLFVKLNALSCRLFDSDGFSAKIQTKKFLKWANEYNPDELWLHNLHGYYINVEMLFTWIKSRPNMKVYWTLHDCWAFTGHCDHFTSVNCDKWKSQCGNCPKIKDYPKSWLCDNSKANHDKKKKAFLGVSNLTIYCPSQWLCEICKDSFFSCYPIELKRNNIDLSCFVPRKENCFEKYGLSAKKIVLGVASAWSSSKGLYDFYKLADMLDDDYKIVLVGLSRKQIGRLPKNIFGIERTSSKEELSMIYSSSFVFVNPTYEDTYPTVNIEAQACGTPVITYRTGGSPESVPEENCVEAGNIEEIKRKIVELSIKRGVKTCGQG